MRKRGRGGFTLVEIMIVTGIIALLAAIAIPAFLKARRRSAGTALANDLRTFAGAFQEYNLENGEYPGEMEGPVFLPPGEGINAFLDSDKFTNATSIDGAFDWDGAPAHAYCGISIRPSQASTLVVAEADAVLDDGNLATGNMRWMYGGNRIAYILEE